MEKSRLSKCNIGMEKPLISIIITCYNYGRYLAEAIESALKQTCHNIEIVIVDDGSTDNTKNVATRYPVQYICQKHQGVASAKNNGIKQSRGKFFICLDADDKLAPEHVRKTMEIMMKDPKIGFVRTGSKLWNEDMKIGNIRMPRKIYTKYDILTIGWVGALGSVLIRRAAFDSVGDGYDPNLPAHEDVDLCFRLCLKGWKTEAIFEPLHWYRIHKASRNPKTVQRAKYTVGVFDRKFPIRKACKRLYTFYLLPLRRVIRLISSPIEYLKGIKKKIKVKVWIRSYHWNNPIHQEKAQETFQEIWLTVDLLLEWLKNKELRDYYDRRLKILESRLQKIFSNDASPGAKNSCTSSLARDKELMENA